MATHNIADLDKLHKDAKSLHEDVIIGIGDKIIREMDSTINCLKSNWKGGDAKTIINSLIVMRNEMVRQRNLLDAIAAGICNIAVSYRQIQIVNLGNLPELIKFNGTTISEIPEFVDNYAGEYVGTGIRDAIQMISRIKSSMNSFIETANNIKNSIFDSNYTEGPDRQNAIDSFVKFKTIFDSFIPKFNEVSQNIDTAASNYGV